MRVSAIDLWTGDFVVRHAGWITQFRIETHFNGDTLIVTIADTKTSNDREFPIEMVNGKEFRFAPHEPVDIVRDKPFPNGMHMTQFDTKGKCHGRAHPALEQRLRAEGKIASDYPR